LQELSQQLTAEGMRNPSSKRFRVQVIKQSEMETQCNKMIGSSWNVVDGLSSESLRHHRPFSLRQFEVRKMNRPLILGVSALLFSNLGCLRQADEALTLDTARSNASLQSKASRSDSEYPEISVKDGPTVIKKFIKSDGWQLRNFDLLASDQPKRVRAIRLENGKSVQVHETSIKPSGETVWRTERAFLLEPEVIQVEQLAWNVNSISKFEADGRPFCYVLQCTLAKLDQDGKIIALLASAASLNYYDESGDGIFETFEYGSPTPRIPRWVVESQTK
jgi:hypothetical protein